MDRPRLIELFLVEARQHLAASLDSLGRLEAGDPPAELHRELMRRAHSLKGMAATLDLRPMVELAHAMEELFDEESAPPDLSTRGLIPRITDALLLIHEIVDAVESGDDEGTHSGSAELVRALRGIGEEEGSSVKSGAGEEDLAAGGAPCWRLRARPADSRDSVTQRTVRLLGRLRSVGPVLHVVPLRAPDGGTEELRIVLRHAGPLASLERLLGSIPEIRSFSVRPDTEHLSRKPTTTTSRGWAHVRGELLDAGVQRARDLVLVQHRMIDSETELRDRDLARSELLSRELFSLLNEMRLEPFDSISARLGLCARETSRKLNKPARLVIEGGRSQMDRARLDALVDPLQHMIRNAIDHGIEAVEERERRGKPPVGQLRLNVRRGSQRVQIRLEDDGRGLDPARLRDSAVRAGRIGPEEAAALTEAEALELTTLPGFSTAERITEISGRGVGMDVVRSIVEGLGGRLALRSEPGHGTTIEMTLPVSACLMPVLLVRSSGELYALPSDSILRIGPVDDLDEPARAVALTDCLVPGRTATVRRGPAVAVQLRSGDAPLDLHVDDVLGHRQVLVEPLKEPLGNVGAFTGATLLQDGTIALVVDPTALLPPKAQRRQTGAELSRGGVRSTP